MPVVGGTRAEQAQAGYMSHVCGHVIAGRIGISCYSGILEISQRVQRFVASASAAEAMGLSEAIDCTG